MWVCYVKKGFLVEEGSLEIPSEYWKHSSNRGSKEKQHSDLLP